MRVTILTVGSRGDVDPFIALGAGLADAGFSVRLATHDAYRTRAEGAGLAFSSLPGDPRVLRAAVEPGLVAAGNRQLRVIKHLRPAIAPFITDLTRDAETACRDAEVIIYRDLLAFLGYSLAEAVDARPVAAALVPRTPTRAFAFPSALPFGRLTNRASYRFIEALFWHLLRSPVNEWRTSYLGLPPYPLAGPYRDGLARRVPMLYGFDEAIVRRPVDWPAWHVVTGSWLARPGADDGPSEALRDFVEAGSPPVYAGFGSSATGDAAGTTSTILTALRRTGHRAVLATGWGGLAGMGDADRAALSDQIFVTEHAPYAWLFPRVSAVIHHGGAGTTAAGLRAGRPTIAIPTFGDQFFWSARVAALGAGPPPIPRRRLNADRLTAALRAATTDTAIAANAAAIGDQLRRVDGVANAVALVRQWVESGRGFPGRSAGHKHPRADV